MQENTKPMQEKILKIVENIQEHAGDYPTDRTDEFVEELSELMKEANDAGYLQGLKEGTDIFKRKLK